MLLQLHHIVFTNKRSAAIIIYYYQYTYRTTVVSIEILFVGFCLITAVFYSFFWVFLALNCLWGFGGGGGHCKEAVIIDPENSSIEQT